MGHRITALVVAGAWDETAAEQWDVRPVPLGGGLVMFHIDHYYAEVWQRRRGGSAMLDVPAGFPPVFPREGVVAELAAVLTGAEPPTFAVVMTDYFGGAGGQWACVFTGGRRVPEVADINGALRALGVRAAPGRDEFDTVGLGDHRRQP